MNETLYFGGRRVTGLGFGLGDVGDLLAYRQAWEPFIESHLNLWRNMNEVLENNNVALECPAGVFDDVAIQNFAPSLRSFCAALSLTRRRIGNDVGGGILPQWNAWKDKSSADILGGAPAMLADHQNVVMRVGNVYKDELQNIAKVWGIELRLPDLPSFSLQQEIRARIEAAYISTKGVIQIVGYGIGEQLRMVGDVTQAVAEGLKDTAKALPSTTKWIGIAAGIAAVVVGGALIVYYVPRRQPSLPERTSA